MGIERIEVGRRMSQAVVHGGTVYLAGQVAKDAPDADAATQTRAILKRIDALLGEAGSTKERILSATIWLADIGDFDAMNGEWDAWIPEGCAPARACIESKLASPSFVVEIGIVAAGG